MAEVDISSLEPNSYKYRNEKENKPKVDPIIKKDQIVQNKKSFLKKMAESFFKEDCKDLKNWLIFDVIIPGVRDSLFDMLGRMFYGRTVSKRDFDRGERTDYRSKYRYPGSRDRRDRDDRESRKRSRDDGYYSDDYVDYRDVILKDRYDAERLVDALRERIRNSDSRTVSVAEFLDLIDAPSRYTDNNWGWDDERDIRIRKVPSGFLIDVSEAEYIG